MPWKALQNWTNLKNTQVWQMHIYLPPKITLHCINLKKKRNLWKGHSFTICRDCISATATVFKTNHYILMLRFIICSLLITEMPTSGDLKSGDSLFFTTPPPRKFNKPPPAPHPWQRWELIRTLSEVLHKVHTIKIRILMPEIIFVND